MDPQKKYFAIDSLHSLACFWQFKGGLWCHHPKYQIASFVFQDLHSHRYNGFFTIITRSIRRHTSKDVPKNEKGAFSSKYFCIASIAEMAAHRGVEFFKIHTCSDHSLGTNQERYLDQNILTLTLPGTYALNGWVDATYKKL